MLLPDAINHIDACHKVRAVNLDGKHKNSGDYARRPPDAALKTSIASLVLKLYVNDANEALDA